ncbi:hypothetical protein SEA_HELPFUL_87 [Mycobacterium phage Helpful]|uniref:Uncharacterized protein n=1 Tax=Mycobacterium phage Helpful TaxID=2652420 RepID=A0A5P8DCA2_9CAUD|nr:hypothetical protein SEA_HELPFUL_87 [Mycobacterium phage Helpful]
MNDPAAEAVQRVEERCRAGKLGSTTREVAAAREALKPIQQWYLDPNSKWPQLRELIFPDGDIDEEYP